MNKNNTLGIIYYTDNRIGAPIIPVCQKQLLEAAGDIPIVSVSLKPIDFGENIVLEGRERSYPTMALQILTALEASKAKYVFFCEHDVLYHKSHFDFTPPRDDIYYYNINNWRWLFGADTAITYDGLSSLSGMCCNRQLAIKHYKHRLELIKKWGLDKIRSREPRWARKFGYEPGTKKRKSGGITDEEHIKRKSKYPNIDIRHRHTFSRPKVTLREFNRLPTNWKEEKIENISEWDLRKIFKLT